VNGTVILQAYFIPGVLSIPCGLFRETAFFLRRQTFNILKIKVL